MQEKANNNNKINIPLVRFVSQGVFYSKPASSFVGIQLNQIIGRKGSLRTLKDYWDVASMFEFSVLAEDYAKAALAAEHMFRLEPPLWYLKSTLGNIRLILQFRRGDAVNTSRDQEVSYSKDYFCFACLMRVASLVSSSRLIHRKRPQFT